MASKARRRPILVVDDNIDIRTAVREVLESQGYVVYVASNGAEALSMLELIPPPRLVVLDWMMPVMDGGEFLARLRATGGKANVELPVVLVSASEGVERYAEHDARVDVLPKPFDMGSLIRRVERWDDPAARSYGD